MVLPFDNNIPIDASVVLGKNTDTRKDVTITDDQRVRHISEVGGTGTGKSTLSKSIALQVIIRRESLIYMDVDIGSINDLLVHIPKDRMEDVILLDFSDRRRFLGIHYTAGDRDIERAIEVFKRLWDIGPHTPNLELTLRSSLLTLQYNNLTLDRMPELLSNKVFRASCIANIPHKTIIDFAVRDFWENDYNLRYIQKELNLADSTLNKVRQLCMDKYIAYIIAQMRNTLNIRKDILDKKKILLIHLALKDLEPEQVRRIGAMVLEELKHALFSRDDLDKPDIVNLICDEWHLYLTPDFFEKVLSQGRRYGISAVLATQTLEYFDNKLQAILDQVGTHITFAVGRRDAEKLAPFYAKDPPPELKYEQIYEPEIIKSTKEVVTWEPPEAEQTYNQVEEELAELQAEFRDFELIKALGLALLHLVFGQKGTNKNLSSLKDVHILCNPDFQDIAIATSQKIIPAGSAGIERKTRLPELYKKRSDLVKFQDNLKSKIHTVEKGYSISPMFDFWTSDFLKKRVIKEYNRDNDKIIQALQEFDEEITAELEADRRYDNGYQYIIPATTLTPIEKNIDFLLHADDDFLAQLKGSFFPPHTFTVVKEKEEIDKRENFFDRYIAFLPSILQLFTHPLPEMEVITATSSWTAPL